MYYRRYFKQNLLNVDAGASDGQGGSDGDAANGSSGAEGTIPDTGSDATASSASSAQTLSWDSIKESLPSDLREDSAMATITSMEGLTKGYIHGQRSIGKDKIVVPDKHATQDDYIDIFRRIGSPEKLEDYSIKVAEDVDEKFLNGFKESAHGVGLLPWQAEKMAEYVVGNAKESLDANSNSSKEAIEAQVQGLKSEWGDAFDEKVQMANHAFKHFVPDANDQQVLIESGLGTNPVAMKMLANVAKLMSEDDFIGQGDGNLGKISPSEALEKARAIQGDNDHPYRNPEHMNHRSAKEEVAKLYAVAYPE